MSPTTLSNEELKQEFSQQLQKAEHGVLATSDGNYVTAREMMILSDGTIIWCFTPDNTRKYKQMQANKNVALSINNLQIEGIVTLKGHPLDEENAGFIRMFKEKRPEVYKFWGPMLEDPNSKNTKVLEITPKKITAYKAAGNDSHHTILNIITEIATRVGFAEWTNTDYGQY